MNLEEFQKNLRDVNRQRHKLHQRYMKYFNFGARLEMAEFFNVHIKIMLRMPYRKWIKAYRIYNYYIYASMYPSTSSHPNIHISFCVREREHDKPYYYFKTLRDYQYNRDIKLISKSTPA